MSSAEVGPFNADVTIVDDVEFLAFRNRGGGVPAVFVLLDATWDGTQMERHWRRYSDEFRKK
jgi:hypothetical protein